MLNAFPRLLYFQKKNTFSGDHLGMRMRLCAVQPEEGDRLLRAWVWPEPLCFESTPAEEKTSADFALSEEGLSAACRWVREQYEQRHELWDAHYTKPRT